MSSFEVDPALLDGAMKLLGSVGRTAKDASVVHFAAGGGKLVLRRADNEHLATVSLSMSSEGVADFALEWVKCRSILLSGVQPGRPVSMKYEEDSGVVVATQGKALRYKLPVIKGVVLPQYQSGARSHMVTGSDLEEFCSALRVASTFCVDRVVGRGKFSGLVVASGRITGCTHEGVVECLVRNMPPYTLALPYPVVWTCQAVMRGASTVCFWGLPDGGHPGRLNGFRVNGVSGEYDWDVVWPHIVPSLSFGALVFGGAAPPSQVRVKRLAFLSALESAVAVQGKGDVWVDFECSGDTVVVSGRDVAKTVEGRVGMVLSGSLASEPKFRVRAGKLREVLGAVPDDTVGLDVDSGLRCLVVAFERGRSLHQYMVQ